MNPVEFLKLRGIPPEEDDMLIYRPNLQFIRQKRFLLHRPSDLCVFHICAVLRFTQPPCCFFLALLYFVYCTIIGWRDGSSHVCYTAVSFWNITEQWWIGESLYLCLLLFWCNWNMKTSVQRYFKKSHMGPCWFFSRTLRLVLNVKALLEDVDGLWTDTWNFI